MFIVLTSFSPTLLNFQTPLELCRLALPHRPRVEPPLF